MKKLLIIILTSVSSGVLISGMDLSDSFPSLGPEIIWESAWTGVDTVVDAAGDTTFDVFDLTPMEVAEFTSPSGDNSVGIITVDTASLGGLGMAYGGSAGMTDYSVEANVYVEMNSGYYQAIMTRIHQTENDLQGYQLAANFYAPYYASKIKFRKWNDTSSEIVVLAEWSGDDIPGGAPTVDGWHKLKLVSDGNNHYCYWDDQLLGGGPINDTTAVPITSGYFGAYVWDMFSAEPASIKIDDVIVETDDLSDSFPSLGPEIIWESAWTGVDTVVDAAGDTTFDVFDFTPMKVGEFTSPSGDNSIGIITADTASLGGLGMAYGGSAGMTDYSVEANVYVEMNSGYYQAIMTRIHETETDLQGYQLAANFYAPYYASKIKFRKWNDTSSEIVVLAEWSGDDIPGGAPTVDGWHKLKLVSDGNDHYCYWDDQLLGGGPINDTTAVPITSGYFGAYVWDMFSAEPASIKIDDVIITEVGAVTIDGKSNILPQAFTLYQNYPNPFNPDTRIDFSIKSASRVRLDIYNLRGQLVKTLVNDHLNPNRYTFTWDGTNVLGQKAPSGVYLYTLLKDNQRASRKMLLMK